MGSYSKLNPLQNHHLYKWMEENKLAVMTQVDERAAIEASQTLGFTVSVYSIRGARTAMGWTKQTRARPMTHVEYTDEETQVRVNALAHAAVTLFQILGEDNRPACRRLQELFPGAGSINHG